MDDQANDLRRLARQGLQADAPCYRHPKLVLITSGKGGAGTTTLAIAVAAVAAQRGHRTVLVDANPHGGDVALLCRLAERRTLADLISNRCSLNEALDSGPAGIRVLPGAWAQDVYHDYSPAAQQRLIEQLRALGQTADFVIIDAGCGSGPTLRRFWQAADVVVAVTTTETTSVMDTYASIKLLAPRDIPGALLLLVNLSTSKAAANDVHQRLSQACRRMLGLELQYAGYVGPRLQAVAAANAGDPLAPLPGRSRRELTRVVDAVLAAAGNTQPPMKQDTRLPPMKITA